MNLSLHIRILDYEKTKIVGSWNYMEVGRPYWLEVGTRTGGG